MNTAETLPPPPVLTNPTPAAPPVVPSVESRRPLLGEWLTRPLHLLWIGALPQALMLWLNLRAWHFISGEVDGTQRTLAAVTLGAELFLLLGSVSLAVALRVRRQTLAWTWNWSILVSTIGYLWWAAAQFFHIKPGTVPNWIVSDGELLYYQFVLVMPLAFYAGLRLACFDSRRSLWKDLGVTALVGACTVSVFLAAAEAMGRWGILRGLPTIAFVLTLLVMTLLLLGALMRVLTTAYVSVRRRGPAAMGWLVFVVGIFGPLAGLVLNVNIPFPASFQTWQVYALAVANGLLLLLPNHRNPLLHRLLWLGQCATFPFSLYFFLVFLPVLPLCLPAMFWLGAGLLLVVPSALFVVHLQRLVDGYHCEVRDGRGWLPAALGVGAALVIPAVYIGGAALDRATLRGALDYAYTPSYRADARPFRGDPQRVERSLENLRDFKAGVDLPFLTDLYKGVVFGGLFLPDEKMRHVYHVFAGREMPEAKEGMMSIFGSSPATGRGRGQTQREAPPRLYNPSTTEHTALVDLAQTTEAEGPIDRAHLTLTMENSGAGLGEFVTQIHLPEGVRVTGFWLHVGPERVPGRLVERKTALWVYHRIRDAEIPRDPGLLSYVGPETAELRVYPFAGGERRVVEIELRYPAALAASITVGDRALAPRDSSGAADVVVLTPTGAAGATITFPPGAAAKLPAVTRRPYLHLLMDRSAGSDVDAAALRRALQSAAERFPEAREAWLTTVSYECREPLAAAPMPLKELLAALDDEKDFARRLPLAQGGDLEERALRRALLGARERLARAADANAPDAGRYPVFVIVRGSKTTPLADGDEIGGPGSGGTAAFAQGVPEARSYFVVTTGDNALQEQAFYPTTQTVSRVALLRYGVETVAVPVDAAGAVTARFVAAGAVAAEPSAAPAPGAPAALSVLDPNTQTFAPLTGQTVEQVAAGTPFARATAAVLSYRNLIENPAEGNVGLARLAAFSRESGALTGATSYIVVENSAQWKILEQKEKQKLANSVALEIEQTPEPGTWVMIALGGIGLVAFARRQRLQAWWLARVKLN